MGDMNRLPPNVPGSSFRDDWFEKTITWLEGNHWTARLLRYWLWGSCCMLAVVFCIIAWLVFDADYFDELKAIRDNEGWE